MRMLCVEWRLLASLELSNGIIHQFGYSVSENRERGEWRDEGEGDDMDTSDELTMALNNQNT